MAKKKTKSAKPVRRSASTEQGLFEKHSMLGLLLVLFIGVMVIGILLKIYEDGQEQEAMDTMNTVQVTTPTNLTPTVSPTAASQY